MAMIVDYRMQRSLTFARAALLSSSTARTLMFSMCVRVLEDTFNHIRVPGRTPRLEEIRRQSRFAKEGVGVEGTFEWM
jgi:hypothetical protein